MDATRPGLVLVVEDDPRQLDLLRLILEHEGHDVLTTTTAESAVPMLRERRPDVLLTDLRLPGRDGVALLEETERLGLPTSTILVTAHGSIDNAVAAMKKGAFDYLTKPVEKPALVLAVRRGIEKARLVRENAELRRQLTDRFAIDNLVGVHGTMQDVIRLVQKVAPSDTPVLVTGESGTGKELVARALHYNSPRRARPLCAVNAAALPESLLESELFGHERGAFTGADTRRLGLFEQAQGGTLFLDEIGETSLATQAKLLRALQEREIRRLGGNAAIPVDVRVVAATNRDLARLIAEGRFRQDLYYRLNVVPIALPPLRARRTDIPLLVEHFLAREAARRPGERKRRLDARALDVLMSYSWPGNVRQLESVIERAVLLAEDEVITARDLPEEVRAREGGVAAFQVPDEGLALEAVERSFIEQALRKAGTVSGAARLLSLSRRTLQYRMEKFGLTLPAPNGAGPARGGSGG